MPLCLVSCCIWNLCSNCPTSGLQLRSCLKNSLFRLTLTRLQCRNSIKTANMSLLIDAISSRSANNGNAADACVEATSVRTCEAVLHFNVLDLSFLLTRPTRLAPSGQAVSASAAELRDCSSSYCSLNSSARRPGEAKQPV